MRQQAQRETLDAVVAGGGVVGAAAALMLAREGMRVALVDPKLPTPWQREQRDLRVFAFAPDNAALLQDLGVWQAIVDARVQPYRGMRVWDAAAGKPLVFDAGALAQPQLGWIVENNLLIDRLWQGLRAAGVQVYCPAAIETLQHSENGVRLGLSDGLSLDAGLALAADGGQSKLRQLAGIDVKTHDYQQRGVVAYIHTEKPHQNTCWQRFLPTGTLAVLPFHADADPALQGHLASIVWALPHTEAQWMLEADQVHFEQALEAAFASELGHMQLQSARAAFPLRRQLATQQYAGRVLLLGDAAHVVHPLAGQGVNLGLRDVSGLQAVFREAKNKGRALASASQLARWARQRRSDNALGAYSFEAINTVFSNDAFLPTLLRGHALGALNRLPPVVRALWRHAAGV